MPGPYTVPFTFIPGTTIFSSQVNANFTSGNNNLNTHEAANSGVHGITGNFVDTGSNQGITGIKSIYNANPINFYSDSGTTLVGSIHADIAGANLLINSADNVFFNTSIGVPANQPCYFDQPVETIYIKSDATNLIVSVGGAQWNFLPSGTLQPESSANQDIGSSGNGTGNIFINVNKHLFFGTNELDYIYSDGNNLVSVADSAIVIQPGNGNVTINNTPDVSLNLRGNQGSGTHNNNIYFEDSGATPTFQIVQYYTEPTANYTVVLRNTTSGGGQHGFQFIPNDSPSNSAIINNSGELSLVDRTAPTGNGQNSNRSFAKAWAKVVGTTIESGYNVSSVTNGSTGNYTVNWTTSFSSTDYAIVVVCSGGVNTNVVVNGQNTGSCTLKSFTASTGTAINSEFMIVVFGT